MANVWKIRLGVILSLGVLASGCGKKDVEDDRREEPVGDALGQSADLEASQSLTTTATYFPQQMDILVLREHTGRLRRGQYAQRLELASSSFAARLMYSGLDFHLAFLSTGEPRANRNAEPPLDTLGEIQAGPPGGDILIRDPSLLSAVEARLVPREDGHTHEPLTSLSRFLEEAQTPGTPPSSFLRPEAFLAIVVIQEGDETGEQLLPEDLTARLDDVKGPGQWSVSAIAPDWEGCEIAENQRTNEEDYVRRNLVLRLVRDSGGYFGSICDKTYTYFFDQFLFRATPHFHFPVTLPSPALWSSIKVVAGHGEVQGWRYQPGDTTLYVPRTVPRGEEVVISYQVDDGSKGNVAPTFEEEMAILQERELSPGEKQFVDEINPILRRWCDGGGCHGRGTSRNQYVDRYKTTLSGKMLILDYVQRPVDDPLHMPQGQTMAQADLDALVNWLSSQ